MAACLKFYMQYIPAYSTIPETSINLLFIPLLFSSANFLVYSHPKKKKEVFLMCINYHLSEARKKPKKALHIRKRDELLALQVNLLGCLITLATGSMLYAPRTLLHPH